MVAATDADGTSNEGAMLMLSALDRLLPKNIHQTLDDATRSIEQLAIIGLLIFVGGKTGNLVAPLLALSLIILTVLSMARSFVDSVREQHSKNILALIFWTLVYIVALISSVYLAIDLAKVG